ncbi:hypothetical protein [Methanoculleus sp. UBA413]|jgi:hypothetical protein|uniref:hypothetical protein n=1 Tax=Methanoculleus sp. UBA413 TaxID=1915509 RepID=UPI00257B2B63|nr:hypothetical protein [Methanoculleus sp. UBA413]
MGRPHLLFMSAGERINQTFPICVKSLEEITHTFIVVEEGVYHDLPDDPEHLRSVKPQIRQAIEDVRAICKPLAISFAAIRTPDTTIHPIRDALLATTRQYPEARCSFNLSGGTKMLSLSLFIMALWLDARIYLTPANDCIEQVLIPRMHLDDVRRNPNYTTALSILSHKGTGSWTPRQEFGRELEKQYRPSRFSGDHGITRIPNRGTITKILQQLIGWNLIEESFCRNSRKAKQYRLTLHGEFAWKVLQTEDRDVAMGAE